MRYVYRLRQSEVDNLRRQTTALLQTDHDVGGFDIPVDEALLVYRGQTASDLRRNVERKLYLKPLRTLDEILQSLSL